METTDNGQLVEGFSGYAEAGVITFIPVKQARQALRGRAVATTPLTGATLTCTAASYDQKHYVTPAGTIAALTFVLPALADADQGQEITLHTSQIVTALTVTAGTGTTLGGAALTATAANTTYRWTLVGTVWVRL